MEQVAPIITALAALVTSIAALVVALRATVAISHERTHSARQDKAIKALEDKDEPGSKYPTKGVDRGNDRTT